jgi:amino acid permease
MMIFVCPALFIFWKVMKKTKFYAASEIDIMKDVAEIEEYEMSYDREKELAKAAKSDKDGKLRRFIPNRVAALLE